MRQRWNELEMVVTLAFYLFDNKPLDFKRQVQLSENLHVFTNIKRTGSSIGLRIANYQSVDPSYKGKGLTGGGKDVIRYWNKYVTEDPELTQIKQIYDNFMSDIISHFEKDDILDSLPERSMATISIFNRSSKVKNDTLKRAKGICEFCKKDAPFTTKSGKKYLEVHHVISLSDNGSDKLDNTLALCPNCHMRLHHGEDLNDDEILLIEKVLTSDFFN